MLWLIILSSILTVIILTMSILLWNQKMITKTTQTPASTPHSDLLEIALQSLSQQRDQWRELAWKLIDNRFPPNDPTQYQAINQKLDEQQTVNQPEYDWQDPASFAEGPNLEVLLREREESLRFLRSQHPSPNNSNASVMDQQLDHQVMEDLEQTELLDQGH